MYRWLMTQIEPAIYKINRKTTKIVDVTEHILKQNR